MSPEKVTVCFLLSFNFPRLLFSSQDSMEAAGLLRTYGRATDRPSQIILIEYHQNKHGKAQSKRQEIWYASRILQNINDGDRGKLGVYVYITGTEPDHQKWFCCFYIRTKLLRNQDDSYIRTTPCYTKKSGPPPRRNINICRTSRRPARGINTKAK